MMLLANLASTLLSDYDFQITEIHHKNKKDIPSGTAIKIADEIEKVLQRPELINAPAISHKFRKGRRCGRTA